MVDGSFRENIFAAEYFSNQDFPGNEYEILWVEYFNKLPDKLQLFPRVKTLTLDKKGIYHSSCCFNRGIMEAKGEVLVIPDADVMVEKDFLSVVHEEHRKNEQLVMYFYRYCQEEKFFRKDNLSIEYIRKTSKIPMPDNYGGCLSVRKKWLLETGGYEQHEAFASGDHANGRDVYTRLKNLGLYVKWHPAKFLYHPWHPGTCGLGADRNRYKRQHEIIDYRNSRLITKAFKGIDNKISRLSMPPELRE
jgi:hypothetical protein